MSLYQFFASDKKMPEYHDEKVFLQMVKTEVLSILFQTKSCLNLYV